MAFAYDRGNRNHNGPTFALRYAPLLYMSGFVTCVNSCMHSTNSHTEARKVYTHQRNHYNIVYTYVLSIYGEHQSLFSTTT